MALSAFDVKKSASDTADAGIDLVVDGISSPAGSVGVTKIMFGLAGANDGIVDSTTPLPVEIFDVSGTLNSDITAIKTAVEGTLTVGSHAVTNAGTFAVQATLDAETTKVIGTVNIASAQTIATTNAGTFAVQEDGAALTALQLIDDAVYVDDADWTALTSKHLLIGGIYQSTPGTITDGDTGPFRVDANGHLIVNAHASTTTSGLADDVSNSMSTPLDAGDNDVYTPTVPYMFDGTTWDRVRGDATNGLLVNLGANNDVTLATLPDTAAGDLAAINSAVSGTLTVGAHAVTNAGTFAVQASQAGTWNVTNVSGTVSLPTGAATAAKQPALGTAGTASTDVITVQGIASGTPLIVDLGSNNDVTLATLPDTSAGDLAAINTATAAIQTAVEGTLTVTGGGGGTEYTEDAAAAANPVGNAIILVREDARAGSLTTTDGDNVALRGNNKGEAYVIDTDAVALLTTIDADTSTIAGDTTSIDGKITACNTGAVVLSSGTVTTVSTVTNLAQLGGVAVTMGTGVRDAGTQRVTIATDDVVPASQSGTWNITNVSGTVSLPTGAATAAKQPALGTAGSASTDVITVQGISSMTALVVDGSGVTQPVSGTVTANLSTTDNTVLDNIDTNTSKGASHHRNIDANAETEIKGSAGTLHWICPINLTNAIAYLHLYDQVAASVTPGTTTPTYTFPIPTTGTASQGAGFVLQLEQAFSTGITYVVTTTTDGSAGDPGTNGVMVNAGYT